MHVGDEVVDIRYMLDDLVRVNDVEVAFRNLVQRVVQIASGHMDPPPLRNGRLLSHELHTEPGSRQWMLSRIPVKREGELRELGALAVYLASDWSGFITGQTIVIDGGEVL